MYLWVRVASAHAASLNPNTHTPLYPSQEEEEEEEGEQPTTTAPGSLGLCPRCGSLYALGFRLPTLPELAAVTWQDGCVTGQ